MARDEAHDDAEDVAERLAQRNILIKPLNDPALGRGYLRVTTALPDDNQRFVAALAEVLDRGQDRPARGSPPAR